MEKARSDVAMELNDELMICRINRILDGRVRNSADEDGGAYFESTSRALKRIGKTRIEPDNPVLNVVGHIGNYWRHGILMTLSTGAYRPSVIAKILSEFNPSRPISQRVLCANLRTLRRDGLVCRRQPNSHLNHVEYDLTPLGRGFVMRMSELLQWVVDHVVEFDTARIEYEEVEVLEGF